MEIARRYNLECVRRYYKIEYSDRIKHTDLKGKGIYWTSNALMSKTLIEVFSEKDPTKKDLKKFDMNIWHEIYNEYKNYTPFIIRLWTQRDLNDIMTERVYLSENKTNDIWSNL